MTTAEVSKQPQCEEGAEGYAAFDALDRFIEQSPGQLSPDHRAVTAAALACSQCAYLEACTESALRWVNFQVRSRDFHIPQAPTVVAGMLLLEEKGVRSAHTVEISPEEAADEGGPSEESPLINIIEADDTMSALDTQLAEPQKIDITPVRRPRSSPKERAGIDAGVAEDMPAFRKRQKRKHDARAALAERRRQKRVEARLDEDEDEDLPVRQPASVETGDAVQEIVAFVLSGKHLKQRVKIGQMRQALSSLAGSDALKDAAVLDRFKDLQAAYQAQTQDFID